MVQINGDLFACAGVTISGYLAGTEYIPGRIAVELNGEIVPKAGWNDTVLQDGDVMEVVRFVGGG